MFYFLRNLRRRRITAKPFPSKLREIVISNFPLFTRLRADDQQELLIHTQIFLSEKQFEGCDGLEITEEMKVTIAVQACLLLLHRETDYYPLVSSILVYPTAYVAPVKEHPGPWLVTEGEEVLDGEAWEIGAVVLSWEDVLRDARGNNDGRNLVVHEFAHQLDMENKEDDGVPLLPHRSMYAAWSKILGAEYERLQSDVDNDRATVIDEYGATSPAEFFAVVTETFFIQPARLKKSHPRLYDQLKEFYLQDPVWYYARNPAIF